MMANPICQLRFIVTENRIGLRVEGTLDLEKGEIVSKGNYVRPLHSEECFLWKQLVETIFGLDASLKGVRTGLVNDKGVSERFSFEIEKTRGGKCTEQVQLPNQMTNWLEKESTDILLHRLACPVSATTSPSGKVVSLSCGSAVSSLETPPATIISKSRLFKFGIH